MKDDLADFEPKPRKPSRILRSLPTISWILLFAFLGLVVPRGARVFADFGVDLPRPTVILISLSHVVVRFAPGFLVFVALAWVVAFLSPESPKPSRRTLIVLSVIPMVLLVLSVIVFAIPMLSLGNRLSE